MEPSPEVSNAAARLQNFVKLQYLLNTTATMCLRQLFIREWNRSTNSFWENTEANGTSFITTHGVRIYNQGQKIQRELMESGNLERWDIPLLANSIKLFPSSDQKMPTKSRNKHIDTLKQARNELSHLGSMEISDGQFKEFWKPISSSLLSLGVSAKDLSESRNIEFGANKQQHASKETEDPNVLQARELKKAGNDFFKRGEFDKAIEKYSEAIQVPRLPFEELAALYSNRSLSFLKSGVFDFAKDDAKGAILVHPTWSKGYFRLGSSYEAMEKFDQAVRNFELALGLNPENRDISNSLACCKHLLTKRARAEHLDPMTLHTTVADTAKMMREKGMETSVHEIHNAHRFNSTLGLPVASCGEGHRYYHGDGRKQDFEQAARCFAKAAAKGNAEGLYNLGIMTKEGKGVERDYHKGLELLRQAAVQSPVNVEFGMEMPNLGVMEAQHCLGLAYANGVLQDFTAAIMWYEKAIKNGSGHSCNNLALMYSKGEGVRMDFNMAIEIWKLGSYYETPRAMENLALHYLGRLEKKLGWDWFNYARAAGCFGLEQRRNEFTILLGPEPSSASVVDMKLLHEKLQEDVESGPVKHLMCKEKSILNTITKNFSQLQSEENKSAMGRIIPIEFSTYKYGIIVSHRQSFKVAENSTWNVAPAKIPSKGITDLFGLKPIFFEDMVATEDFVYERFVLKVTIIEDPIFNRPSIPLIVEDEKKEAQRIYVYNFSRAPEKILDNFGYGSKISIVNPYWRIAKDKLAAIRVDDPSTIIFHANLKDVKRCRFCGKEDSGTVPCRKCKRCFYCSKKCLLDDQKLFHDAVCKKRI